MTRAAVVLLMLALLRPVSADPDPCALASRLWRDGNDLAALKQYKFAEQTYVMAQYLCPERTEKDAALNFNVGQVRRLNGNTKMALWSYRRALEAAKPGSALARKAREWVERLEAGK